MVWGNRILLGTGALVALVLGMSILFIPATFFAGYEIAVGSDIALLSEMKAPAGALMLSAAAMFVALVRRDWVGPGLLVGSLVYFGFGAGRLVALLTDGIPPASLLAAMMVELSLGLLFTAAFWRHQMR